MKYIGKQTEGKDIATKNMISLPSAYQQVEYIQSDGSVYIDSGLKLNGNSRVDITYQFISGTGTARIFGDRTSSSAMYMITTSSGAISAAVQVGYASGWPTVTTAPNTNIISISMGDGKIFVNGIQEVTYAISSFTTSANVILFGASGSYAKAKIYTCSIYQDGTNISRHFIPCYRKSDNVLGMYDVVNDVFYQKSGSGSFTKGRNVDYIIEEAVLPKIPTKTSQLTNDSGFITSSSVGNGTITINQGGTQKGTFTVNQSGNTTINLDAGGGGGGNVTYVELSTPSSTPNPFADYYNKSTVDTLINSPTRTSTSLTINGISGTKSVGRHICIESWHSIDYSYGYRVYDDGYCEQWGYASPGQNITVTLFKTMANALYNTTITQYYSDYTDVYSSLVHTKTASSFVIGSFQAGAQRCGKFWVVRGYLAS